MAARASNASGAADALDDESVLVPSDVEAHSFELDSDHYVLFTFPSTQGRLDVCDLRTALTPTETAVATLVLEGRSNLEIARARGTSPRTVANQLVSVYQKLGVRSRRELASRPRRATEAT